MTVAQILFLGLLGSAYLMFVVVLGWTSHQTEKFLKEHDAQQKASSPTGPQAQPKAEHSYDRAA